MQVPAPYADWNWHIWQDGRRMNWHSHGFLQVIHVIDGELQIDWGDGWISCGPGDVHILPPYQAHRLHTPERHRQFGLNWRSDGPEGKAQSLHAALLQVARAGRWHAPDLLQGAQELDGIDGEEMIDTARRTHLLDRYGLGLYDLLSAPGRHPWPRLRTLIRQHLSGPIRVGELCAEADISRAHAQRLCHRHEGCGLAELHARWRLHSAARWLATRPDSIAACAEAFGFADQSQFSRAFKRLHGCSPSSYRRRHAPVF